MSTGMRVGLLWICDSKVPLATSIADARRRHIIKYNTIPDTAHVRSNMLPDGVDEIEIAGVRVLGVATAIPHHIWIGRVGM